MTRRRQPAGRPAPRSSAAKPPGARQPGRIRSGRPARDGQGDGVAVDTQLFKRGNETRLTASLKQAAWQWLDSVARCRRIGLEVKLEGPDGRVVDLVGVGPDNAIYVVEVKASRADFARDDHTPAELAALKERSEPLLRRGQLARQARAQAEEYAQRVRPEDWEEEPSYRLAKADDERLRREEQAYHKRVTSLSIKFHDPNFLSLADYHYIMAPRRLALHRNMPPQWGLLDETPAVVIPAPRQDIRKDTSLVANARRAIARSGPAAMMHAQGARFTEEGASRERPPSPPAPLPPGEGHQAPLF